MSGVEHGLSNRKARRFMPENHAREHRLEELKITEPLLTRPRAAAALVGDADDIVLRSLGLDGPLDSGSDGSRLILPPYELALFERR